MGAYNAMQQSDVHSYWEFNYLGTNWIHPLCYAAEVARVNPKGNGIITAAIGDIDTATDGFKDNSRLFLPPTVFNRFAVTREINDGLLAPRFAPSQRAWVLTGKLVAVSPAVPASAGEDSDDR